MKRTLNFRPKGCVFESHWCQIFFTTTFLEFLQVTAVQEKIIFCIGMQERNILCISMKLILAVTNKSLKLLNMGF